MGVFDFWKKTTQDPSVVTKVSRFPISIGGNITSYRARLPLTEKTLQTIARNFATLKVSKYNMETGEDFKDETVYTLTQRANRLQTAYDFHYNFFYNLFAYGNAVAIPEFNEKGDIISIENIDMSNFSLKFVVNGNKKDLVFYNEDKMVTIQYEEIIHMRLSPDQIQDDEISNLLRNNSIPEIIDENLSVLLSELKSNFDVKGVLTLGKNDEEKGFNTAHAVDEEIKAKRAEDLIKRIRDRILVLDDGEKWEEKSGGFAKLRMEEIDSLEDKFYSYFGLNSNIINGSYSYNEFAAFFKNTIHPKIVNYEQELQSKLIPFSDWQDGIKIAVRSENISGSTLKELSVFLNNGVYNGYLNKNEVRDYIGKAPIKDGDIFTGNLNMADINNGNGNSNNKNNGGSNE